MNINVSQIEKSAKNYKDVVNKDCFITGKKYDEYKVIFKDIIDEFNKSKEILENKSKISEQIIKEKEEENINDNNDINSNLESINNMINNGDNSENKNEINNENINNEEENNQKENSNLENKEINNSSKNINQNKNDDNNNSNIQEKKIKGKRTIDDWLNEMNSKIEILSETVSKNEEATNPSSSINIREEENNYEYISKKLQKINAEKNKKDLESVFKEMFDIDLDIKKLDRDLEQSLNNSGSNKISGKELKDLNKNLDNIINKLVKNLDLNGKVKENTFENI